MVRFCCDGDTIGSPVRNADGAESTQHLYHSDALCAEGVPGTVGNPSGRQAKHLARARRTAQFVRPEADHGMAAALRDTLGQQHLATEFLAERLHSAHLVDRRTDDGEVEAPGGADVAVYDIAEVEGDAEIERRPALGGAPGVERRIAAAGIDRGAHGVAACSLGTDLARSEDRQKPVAEKTSISRRRAP
jgi:hypothetical protein